MRDDIQAGRLYQGELTSRRRGCDALVSHDHGQTWNLDRRYELDSFEFLRPDRYWVDGVCGHIGAMVLDDGHVLAVYGNYPVGAVLIKWKPDAVAEQANFFVSPTGKDENAGTFDAPFLTLERARRRPSPQGEITGSTDHGADSRRHVSTRAVDRVQRPRFGDGRRTHHLQSVSR